MYVCRLCICHTKEDPNTDTSYVTCHVKKGHNTDVTYKIGFDKAANKHLNIFQTVRTSKLIRPLHSLRSRLPREPAIVQ